MDRLVLLEGLKANSKKLQSMIEIAEQYFIDELVEWNLKKGECISMCQNAQIIIKNISQFFLVMWRDGHGRGDNSEYRSTEVFDNETP